MSMYVNHLLAKAPFVKSQIRAGKAQFACIFSSKHTGHRRIFLSSSSEQVVEWDQSYLGELTSVHSFIVTIDQIAHTFTSSDEVAETWVGKSIYFPKGARLSCLLDILSVSEKSNLNIAKTLDGTKPHYREFDSEDFTSLRRSLIGIDKTLRQVEFIKAFCDKESFENWVNEKLYVTSRGVIDPEVLSIKLNERKFTNMPREIEMMASGIWKSLTPRVASKSSFWGMVTTKHIVNEVIAPSFLAADPTNKVMGLKRMKNAIAGGDKKEIDDVARTILRRFCGLGEARGHLRSIRSNCSFSRAWWREEMIAKATKFTGVDEGAVVLTLHKSQEFWEKVANLLFMKESSFGDERVNTAFIIALSKHVRVTEYRKLFNAKGIIDKCLEKLKERSRIQELGIFQIEDIIDFVARDIIASQMEKRD